MKRLLFVLLLVAVLPAMADITVGLYNTGVDNSGNLLAAGAVDPHYTLVSYPADGVMFTGSPGSAVVIEPGWPLASPWVPNTSNSQWIGPRSDAGNGEPPQPGAEDCADQCYYAYQITFDVTQLDVVLKGLWTSDNGGYIVLNGKEVAGSDTGTGEDIGTYGSFHSFTITGLNEGSNTLDFDVQNFGYANSGWPGANPTGVQVQFTSVSVPEADAPVQAAVMFGGVFLLAGALKRIRA